MAPRGSKVGQQGPRVSRGRPKGSQVVKGWAYRVPGGQGGLQGPRGSRVGPQGPRGSRGRPIGSQGVKG